MPLIDDAAFFFDADHIKIEVAHRPRPRALSGSIVTRCGGGAAD